VTDRKGRPLRFLLSGGHCFDGKAAVPLLKPLPPPKKLLADKAYDCAAFRDWLFAGPRLASETSIPPNLTFQLYSVASDIPYFRQSSAAFAPASCSRNTATICSTVNLLRFIGPSLVQAGL